MSSREKRSSRRVNWASSVLLKPSSTGSSLSSLSASYRLTSRRPLALEASSVARRSSVDGLRATSPRPSSLSMFLVAAGGLTPRNSATSPTWCLPFSEISLSRWNCGRVSGSSVTSRSTLISSRSRTAEAKMWE